MIRFHSAAVAALLTLSAGAAFAQALSPAAAAKIDAAAQAAIAGGKAPGVQVAVLRGDQIVLSKGYGVASLESGEKVSPQSVFRIGSITKQFTAAAILLLAQDGRLSLDDKLSAHLPDIPKGDTVTLRQLLNQTSGLNAFTSRPEFARESRLPHSTDQMVKFIAADSNLSQFEPGSKYQYSNTNYYLLGAVVEKVSGQRLAAFLEARIFKPLGLNDTAFDNALEIVPHRAGGYVPNMAAPGTFVNAPYTDIGTPGGAGAMRSTAEDLARWHAALFAGKVVDADNLKAMTTAGLLNDQTPVTARPATAERPARTYGFGLTISEQKGQPVIGHNGAINGFFGNIDTYPKQKLTVVVLTNGVPNDAGVAAIEDAALAAALAQ